MNLNLAPISNLNFRANSMGFLGKFPENWQIFIKKWVSKNKVFPEN